MGDEEYEEIRDGLAFAEDSMGDHARLMASIDRLRAVEVAAREVLATWDRTLPEGVGIEFFSTLIGLRDALAGA